MGGRPLPAGTTETHTSAIHGNAWLDCCPADVRDRGEKRGILFDDHTS